MMSGGGLMLTVLAAVAAGSSAHVEAERRLQEVARLLDAEGPRALEGATDPWGNRIRVIPIAGGYWLVSWGADGAPGGEGDAADVVYIAR